MLGVLCFSFTFPMTRLALAAFDPVMIALVRGAGAGSAALVYVVLSRSRVPPKMQLFRIAGAAMGMVILFPILVSTALRFVPATHASVLAAILPLLTACFGVIRGRETGTLGFWVSAVAGTVSIALVCGYRSGFQRIDQADLLLLAGFGACAYGYAEGGLLSRELGGWQTICWILVSVLPVELTGVLGFASFHGAWVHPPGASAWIGIAYLTLISQFIGFYFYYKGLGLGGVARMSQAQLLLPFLAIFASSLLLGEEIDGVVVAGAAAITGIVLLGRWSLRQRQSANVNSPAMEEERQGTVASEMRPYRTRADVVVFGTGSLGADLRADCDRVGSAASGVRRKQPLRPEEDPATLMVWLLLIVASMASLLLAAAELFGWNWSLGICGMGVSPVFLLYN